MRPHPIPSRHRRLRIENFITGAAVEHRCSRHFCKGVNMRLSRLESGHRLPQKLLLGFIHAITFSEPVDIIKIFMYRPEYFGKPFCDLGHAVLRGSSYWSVGERELLGAFTSNLNQCVF
jgi:hypothetical protein